MPADSTHDRLAVPEITDESLRQDLAARLDERLDPPPTEDTDGEVADHVADHLEEMGYM